MKRKTAEQSENTAPQSGGLFKLEGSYTTMEGELPEEVTPMDPYFRLYVSLLDNDRDLLPKFNVELPEVPRQWQFELK